MKKFKKFQKITIISKSKSKKIKGGIVITEDLGVI